MFFPVESFSSIVSIILAFLSSTFKIPIEGVKFGAGKNFPGTLLPSFKYFRISADPYLLKHKILLSHQNLYF